MYGAGPAALKRAAARAEDTSDETAQTARDKAAQGPVRSKRPCTVSRLNGHDPALQAAPAGSPPLYVEAAGPLDVGEQIRRLEVLARLRTGGILTDDELTSLKRRVLSPRADTQQPAPIVPSPSDVPETATGRAASSGGATAPTPSSQAKAATGASSPAGASKAKAKQGSGPILVRHAPKATYVTHLEVVGTIPVTWRAGGGKRPLYAAWKRELDAAAVKAAARARRAGSELFSVRMEMRLWEPDPQRTDLDNYVKPIQDALAERGVFGPMPDKKGPRKGDERVDHLDVRRRRVSSEAEAGVRAEVWALKG